MSYWLQRLITFWGDLERVWKGPLECWLATIGDTMCAAHMYVACAAAGLIKTYDGKFCDSYSYRFHSMSTLDKINFLLFKDFISDAQIQPTRQCPIPLEVTV